MSFSCTLIAALVALSNIIFCVLPSDLVFTPYADFPKIDQTELGYQFKFYTVQAITQDRGFYFCHSFSKNIRYGAEFYENGDSQKIYHHFAYRLGSLFDKSTYNLMFAGAINYLSDSDVTFTNQRNYDGSLTMTWNPPSPFQIHSTIAREIGKDKMILIGGISFHQYWGILSTEWDGNFLNLSSQVKINNRLIFRSGVTKNMASNSELIIKSSFGFLDITSFVPEKTPEVIEQELEEEKISTVNTAVGLMHLQEGLEFYYQGDYRKALKSYEIAVEFFPESAVVHERLGSIYFKLNEFDKAESEWKKANILNPSSRLEEFIRNAIEKGNSEL